MENEQSVMYDFASLLFQQQRDILQTCMGQEKIPWTTMLAKLFPESNNKQDFSYLIRSYKNGTNDQIILPFQSPATSDKRKSNEITPPDQVKVVAAPYMYTNDASWSIDFDVIAAHKAMIEYFAMFPETKNDQVKPAATGVEHCGLNDNNIQGNSKKNMGDTHRLLAPERQQKWINITIVPFLATQLKLYTLWWTSFMPKSQKTKWKLFRI